MASDDDWFLMKWKMKLRSIDTQYQWDSSVMPHANIHCPLVSPKTADMYADVDETRTDNKKS